MPHIHKLYDYTVSGLIIHEGKVLVLRHKRYTDFWFLPGGHIELDETPTEALYREVQEEVGLSKKHLRLLEVTPLLPTGGRSVSLPVPFDINLHPTDDIHKHIDLCYVLISATGEVKPGAGESQEWCWLNEFEVDDFEGIPVDVRTRILAGLHFALEHVD